LKVDAGERGAMAEVDERPGSGRDEWTEESGRYVMSVAVSLTGVDAYRIRRYEAVGLVRPGRTEGGRRLFSDREVARIREVARLEAEGVNLRGIEVILRMKGGAQAEGGNERNR
jgi:MerR family transcriptional regulator/heat shock protein HspR